MDTEKKPSRTKRAKKEPRRMTRYPWGIITVLLIAVGTVAIIWYANNIDNVPFDQLVFHILVPLKGAGFNPIVAFGPVALGVMVAVGIVYWFFARKVLIPRRVKVRRVMAVTLSLLLVLVIGCFWYMGVFSYLRNIFVGSSGWKTYYSEPTETTITFPRDKRNMIYIVLESMEATFADEAHGGAYETNLIPELSALWDDPETVYFSHNDGYGGGRQASGLTWTAASLVAQMGGIPLKLPVTDANAFQAVSGEYLPGATMIGDILKSEGYYLEMMMGSDAAFAARDDLYARHGGFVMKDYNQLRAEGRIPQGHNGFWGLADRELFGIAKERLTEIAAQDAPFFFSLLTVDTHFPQGYTYPDRETRYPVPYGNAVAWSDHDVGDFVRWCREQDFYDHTTIVLCGDHLSMDKTFFRTVPDEYERTIYNVILNPSPGLTAETKNRAFTMMDFYPTSLRLLGADLSVPRLGYGTDLFSGEPTLCEALGMNAFRDMMETSSPFYAKQILYRTRPPYGGETEPVSTVSPTTP